MFCIVRNCHGKDREGIQTFQIPKSGHLKLVWLQNIKLDPRKRVTVWSRVCSRHFEDDCISNKRLRSGSVPTLELGHDGPVVHQSNFKQSSDVKWVRKCSIQGCSTTSPPCSKMFSFPKCKEREKQWLHICSLKEGSKHLKKKFICKEHFRNEDLGSNTYLPHAMPSLRLHVIKEEDVTTLPRDEMEYDEKEAFNLTMQNIMQHQGEHELIQQSIREQQQRQPQLLYTGLGQLQEEKAERSCQLEESRREQTHQQRQQQWQDHRQELIRQQKEMLVQKFTWAEQNQQLSLDEQKPLLAEQQQQQIICAERRDSLEQNQELEQEQSEQQQLEQNQELTLELKQEQSEEQKQVVNKCQNCEEETFFRQKYNDIVEILGKDLVMQQNENDSCKNCKNEKFFRKQNFDLQDEFKRQAEEHRNNLKACHEERCDIMKRSEQMSKDAIQIRGHISEGAKVFAELICNGYPKMYTKAQKKLLLDFYYHNRQGLMYMRDSLGFALPANSTINRWSTLKNLQPDTNEIVTKALKAKSATMTGNEISSVDEIALRPEAEYNVKTDEVDGFEDDKI